MTTLLTSVALLTGGMAMAETRPKLLLLHGGPVHDHVGICNAFEEHLNEDGRYDITRVEGDLDQFLPENIEKYDVVVFYWTLDSINDAQLLGLLNWVKAGGAYVTFHSGADSFRDSPEYRNFVGGYFITHPAYRHFEVSVLDAEHPITQGIEKFITLDEQYVLSWDPRVHVLMNSLWQGELMPIAWVKQYGQGNLFYCSLGHDEPAVRQEETKKIFVRGVAWAAGLPIVDPPSADEAE